MSGETRRFNPSTVLHALLNGRPPTEVFGCAKEQLPSLTPAFLAKVRLSLPQTASEQLEYDVSSVVNAAGSIDANDYLHRTKLRNWEMVGLGIRGRVTPEVISKIVAAASADARTAITQSVAENKGQDVLEKTLRILDPDQFVYRPGFDPFKLPRATIADTLKKMVDTIDERGPAFLELAIDMWKDLHGAYPDANDFRQLIDESLWTLGKMARDNLGTLHAYDDVLREHPVRRTKSGSKYAYDKRMFQLIGHTVSLALGVAPVIEKRYTDVYSSGEYGGKGHGCPAMVSDLSSQEQSEKGNLIYTIVKRAGKYIKS